MKDMFREEYPFEGLEEIEEVQALKEKIEEIQNRIDRILQELSGLFPIKKGNIVFHGIHRYRVNRVIALPVGAVDLELILINKDGSACKHPRAPHAPHSYSITVRSWRVRVEQ